MVARTDRVLIVATGDKIGSRTFARICGVDAVATLVTDQSAPPRAVEALRDAGVDVVVAPG
ncbi:MAG: alkaline phosphatase, partial [Lapillicoccus sp.]